MGNIRSNVVLFFLFVACALVVFLGVQWFSSILGGFFFWGKSDKGTFSSSLEASASNALGATTYPNLLPSRNWQVQDLKIDADAAIAVEIESGKEKMLFNKDSDKKVPIASLTKLMTALIVLEKYQLDTPITISAEAMAQIGEQGQLQKGQVVSVENLLYIMLMESSNRAAFALSQAMGNNTFITAMNARAQELGLANTHFADSSGLDSRSYSTAEDIAKLSAYVFKNNPLFRKIISLKEYELYLSDGSFHHKLESTNELLGSTPNVIGGKTGWTSDAKGCFMVIERSPKEGNEVVYVILGSQDRFGEAKNIIDWIHYAYTW